TPIPATATRSASTSGTDTAVSGSGHRTPHPQSSGCRIRAPSAALSPGIADNRKDVHDSDHRRPPCTAGSNRCAGVAFASDLHGKLSRNWSCGGLRSRPLTLYGALPHPILWLLRLFLESKN